MAGLAYLKGVRTRFRNTLESEIRMAKDLLTSDYDERNLNEIKVNITKCLEKLKTYSGKVEFQSEKLSAAMGEEDLTEIEKVVDEDCLLCANATDIYLELKQFKENIVLVKEKAEVKEPPLDVSNTTQLIELQKNMQHLLDSQLKQQEVSNKKGSELSSCVKLPKLSWFLSVEIKPS